jgi:siroheme synthase-like protein
MADREAAPTIPVYPLYLTGLDQVVTVVVGGGPIGERKIRALLAGGAHVRLIAPQATPQLQTWAAGGQLIWLQRPYQSGDLADAFLAIAATDQRSINTQVASEARNLRILCNVADHAEEGNFHTPAVHRQEDIVIAVGSTGKQPRRVRQIRDLLANLCESLDIFKNKG